MKSTPNTEQQSPLSKQKSKELEAFQRIISPRESELEIKSQQLFNKLLYDRTLSPEKLISLKKELQNIDDELEKMMDEFVN